MTDFNQYRPQQQGYPPAAAQPGPGQKNELEFFMNPQMIKLGLNGTQSMQ
jgi:hypothetical protein